MTENGNPGQENKHNESNCDNGVPASENGSLNLFRGLITIVSVALILAVSVGGFMFLKNLRKPPPKKPMPERALKVQAVAAEPGSFRPTILENGVIQAKATLPVIPQVSGRVVAVHPELRQGGVIEKGQLLYRIEQDDYRDAVAQAQAQLESLRAQIALQEKQRERLETQADVARRAWELAQEETSRIERLHERGAAAEAEVNRQRISEQSSLAALEQIGTSLALIDPTIEQLKSSMKQAEAALSTANLNLSRTEYRTPFAARVITGKLDEGQVIGPGAPVATLIDASVFELPVPVAVSDLRAVLPQVTAQNIRRSPVAVSVSWKDDQGGVHRWPGRAVRLSTALDARTRMVDVIVELRQADADVELMPGMFCAVTFEGALLEDVAPIPRRALREGNKVFIAGDGGLEIRSVEIWRRQGEEIFVTDGINKGEKIITSVVQEEMPGMKVIVLSRGGGSARDEGRGRGPEEEYEAMEASE